MSIRERILQYLDFKQVTKYQFYKETGLSNGFLDKDGAIGSDKCEKICYHYPDLRAEWLLLGKGMMMSKPYDYMHGDPITELLNDSNIKYSTGTESERVKELKYTIELQQEIINSLKNKLLDRDATGASVADAG